MKMLVGWVLAVAIAGGGVAHSPSAAAQSLANSELPGWDAVQHLKPGTQVMVEELSTPGGYQNEVPCKLLRVDDASLTCRPEGRSNRRIIYPAEQLLTVYQVKMRVTAGSWARIVLFPGLGFLLGCAITDENADYPLGGIGAAAGGLAAVEHISKAPTFKVIYRRTEAAAGGTVSP
jgi:hypothetical protein